jgi:hypothetical protein
MVQKEERKKAEALRSETKNAIFLAELLIPESQKTSEELHNFFQELPAKQLNRYVEHLTDDQRVQFMQNLSKLNDNQFDAFRNKLSPQEDGKFESTGISLSLARGGELTQEEAEVFAKYATPEQHKKLTLEQNDEFIKLLPEKSHLKFVENKLNKVESELFSLKEIAIDASHNLGSANKVLSKLNAQENLESEEIKFLANYNYITKEQSRNIEKGTPPTPEMIQELQINIAQEKKEYEELKIKEEALQASKEALIRQKTQLDPGKPAFEQMQESVKREEKQQRPSQNTPSLPNPPELKLPPAAASVTIPTTQNSENIFRKQQEEAYSKARQKVTEFREERARADSAPPAINSTPTPIEKEKREEKQQRPSQSTTSLPNPPELKLPPDAASVTIPTTQNSENIFRKQQEEAYSKARQKVTEFREERARADSVPSSGSSTSSPTEKDNKKSPSTNQTEVTLKTSASDSPTNKGTSKGPMDLGSTQSPSLVKPMEQSKGTATEARSGSIKAQDPPPSYSEALDYLQRKKAAIQQSTDSPSRTSSVQPDEERSSQVTSNATQEKETPSRPWVKYAAGAALGLGVLAIAALVVAGPGAALLLGILALGVATVAIAPTIKDALTTEKKGMVISPPPQTRIEPQLTHAPAPQRETQQEVERPAHRTTNWPPGDEATKALRHSQNKGTSTPRASQQQPRKSPPNEKGQSIG